MSGPQRASAVESLFPPGVVAFELRGGSSPDELYPVEHEYIVRAIPKRAAEFAAGRACARAAMSVLGIEPTAIPGGQDRAPLWPEGVVGSITHTDHYCLAVVGESAKFASLGVDVEAAGRLKPDLWRLTLHPDERAALEGMDEAAAQAQATLLFSAKEAFYKCQYALTRGWVGFEDVIVSVGPDRFEVTLVNETREAFQLQKTWPGRLLANDEHVVTAVALGRRDSPFPGP